MINTVLWAGQRGLLLEFNSLAEALTFGRHIEQTSVDGLQESVVAARTVLLSFRTRAAAQAAVKQVRRIRPKTLSTEEVREVTLEVHYNGEDLQQAAELADMSPEALIDWHTSTVWTGAFSGFAPGFLYCVPMEEAARRRRNRRSAAHPQFPRLQQPRTEVPGGAVAVAGEFSAVYPAASPGGWQLIGNTDAQIWDAQRRKPALIRPGDTVRYRRRAESLSVSVSAAASNQPPVRRDMVLEILHPGTQTLVQDLGRSGFSEVGVTRSGAADAQALRQANQLVGNEDGAAGFEVLVGGLELEVHQTAVLAVTGAEVPLEIFTPAQQQRSNMAVAGTGADAAVQSPGSVRTVPPRAPFWMFSGERLRMGSAARGLRSYVAISGGLAAQEVLGSRSTDQLSGLGPAAVTTGDAFALVGATSRFVGIADVSPTALPAEDEPTVLRFTVGPRQDYFAGSRGDNPGLRVLQRTSWRVSAVSNRVGLRLNCEHPEDRIQRTREGELASEPMLHGSIQVPPSGEPVIFLSDHPVTGGYPVIGVLVRADRGVAAQLPPGSRVQLLAVDPDTLQPSP